jgi:hypothetical protein
MKRHSLAVAALAALSLTAATQAEAVTTCHSLQLYAGGISPSIPPARTLPSLCKSLSPTTQNLWVCELASNPDVHLTFNATNNLHITVRKLSPACEGNAQFGGTFPGRLTLSSTAAICGVNVASYLDRLNQVPQVPIVAAMNNAVTLGRISQSTAQSYIDTAKKQKPTCS